MVDALGEASDGIYVTGFFDNPTTNPEAYDQFVADLEAAGFDDDSGFRNNSYSAVQVVAEVIGGLPEKTGPALLAALPTVTGLDLPLLPPAAVRRGRHRRHPARVQPCAADLQLDGGEFTTLTDGFIDMLTGEPC